MQQRTPVRRPAGLPIRRVRLLVEDPEVLLGPVVSPTPAVEITTCSGPCGDREVCPLVMDGTCPLGRFDVVVSCLDDPWASPVRAAWLQTGTPVIEGRDLAPAAPADRLAHHVGAALQCLFALANPVDIDAE